MSYRVIDFEIWQDSWFDDLSHEAKLVFVFLFSSPNADRCGTQQYAPKLIGYFTGISRDKVEECVAEMSDKVSVVDGRIFCHSFIRHQCKTGNFKAGMAASFKTLSPAIQQRIIEVSGLSRDELNGKHGSSESNQGSTGSNSGSTGVRPTSNPANSNKEQVTSNIHTSVDAHASTSERVEYSPEFDEFWNQYPRHIDKKRAYKAWCARLKAGYSPAAMIQAATNYAAHCKSNSTEERFIKHPATFIGPELSFMDEPWQKPITSKPKDDLDPPDEDENARIKNWMIERMTPEQRKQYDKVMSRAQKDYYDRLNRRPTDAHVA